MKMEMKADVLVQQIPIRFLPTTSQGLKTWLTNNGRELSSIQDLSTEVKLMTYPNLWMSPSAGDSLCSILLLYKDIHTKNIEINIPKKYESLVNPSTFIKE